MKKFILNVLALCLAVMLAVYAVPPVRQRVAPYLPSALAKLLPGEAGGAIADNSAGKGGNNGKSGAGAPIAVQAATAATADLPLIERTYGVIQSPAVATINARIASQVTEVHVKNGQMVKAGDLLVVLDDRLLQAQLDKDRAAVAKDQALAVSAELDAERARQLVAKQAGTQQSADQAKAAAEAAEATVDSDKAAVLADQAQLTFTRIVAPISGRLGAVSVNVGDLVMASGGSSGGLMTITEMVPLKVAFHLPERVLGDIRSAMQDGGPVPVRALRSGTTTLLTQGGLDFIDSAIDVTSGTIAMSATIANDDLKLWPGQFVDVEVEYGKLGHAVVVPQVAVQRGQSGAFVWLVKSDNTVEARNVTVSRTEADRAAIAEGLTEGDQVVIEGQLRLKPGTAVAVVAKPSGSKAPDAAAKTSVEADAKATSP